VNEAIVIDRGCCGPPGSGNGGYVGGLLAARLGGNAEASFRRPVPLGRELQLDHNGEVVSLHDAAELLVEARPVSLHILVPPPPSLAEAREASGHYIGRRVRLPFARCIGCGIERTEGEGLRIFAGPVAGGGDRYAAPWTPHDRHADARGDVRTEFVWTALDCSGGFAITGEEQRTVLTARLAVRIDIRPRAGEPLIVSAWVIERGERKHISGTALFTAEGRLLAVGRALWVEPRV
jgi:hypothetical protein